MSTHDPAREAIAELDQLTSAFTQAEARHDKARDALHAAIIKHLRARSAPPGRLASHTPYDRNHVGRLSKSAGVPPLRGPDADPAPEYDDKVEAKAFRELDRLTDVFQAAVQAVDDAREPLQEAIVRIYTDRTLTPGVISDHVPYDRNHVGRIVKAAGAPLIRG